MRMCHYSHRALHSLCILGRQPSGRKRAIRYRRLNKARYVDLVHRAILDRKTDLLVSAVDLRLSANMVSLKEGQNV